MESTNTTDAPDPTIRYPEQHTDAVPGGSAEPRLLVGPLLRFVDDSRATVWVETDRACTVRVLGHSEPTWSVHGHHYALVVIEGLDAGAEIPYQVHLDDHQAWPPRSSVFPPSVIRTFRDDDRWRFCFGSCRVSAPYDGDGLKQFGADALVALAERMTQAPTSQWPDALLLVGDQVYADDPSAALSERLTKAHTGDGEKEVRGEIHNFEEYTWLYHESWNAPAIRWLLSTVPTCMLLDDHDLRDDWNTSHAWREEMSREPWWRDRVIGAFGSYWVYQHLGNLSPDALDDDDVWHAIRDATDDTRRSEILDEFAWEADTVLQRARWSYHRDFHGASSTVRLLAVDSRCSRRLDPHDRAMLDEKEWDWITDYAHGDVEHLLVATTLPMFLPHSVHHLEGWNEATAAGAWGRRFARVAERLRQAADLEHWSAFRASFDGVVELFTRIGTGPRPPASILVLSGDVHSSYAAQVRLPGVDPAGTAVHQLVMSPFRNPLSRSIRAGNRLMERPLLRRLTRRLSRAAGVREPDVSWQLQHGPWFDNGVMTVALDGRSASAEVDHARVVGGEQVLERTVTLPLTRP